MRRHPKSAVAVVFHRPDAIGRQSVARREARDFLAVDAKESAACGGDEDRSVSSFMHLTNAIRSEHLGMKGFDLSIAQSRETSAVGADP